ncbi:MAG: hypothetical protein ABIV51_05975 [Saprospiraceae bacterium]
MKDLSEREKALESNFKSNHTKIKEMMEFLIRHKRHNEKYQTKNIEVLLCCYPKIGYKFRALIIECMQTSAGVRLSSIGDAMQNLQPLFEKLNEQKSLDLEQFYKILSNSKYPNLKVTNIEGLFQWFLAIQGIGPKIATLTVRNLNLAIENKLLDITSVQDKYFRQYHPIFDRCLTVKSYQL